MIVRARQVLTMQGPPLDGGCVVVKGQRIAAVTRCAEKVDLDLGDAVLFPGLINAHCHLDYTSLAGQVPWQGDFREWLLQLTALKKKLAADDYLRSIQKGLANLMQTATTSLVNIVCMPEVIARLQPAPLRVWWCAELLDLGWGEEAERKLQLAVECLKAVPHAGLAPHAPYTTSAELYRLAAITARQRHWLLTTHLAETAGEHRLFDFFERAPTLEELGLLETPSLIAHANHLSDADADLLARAGASVVHCPRTHRFFQRSPAPWRQWQRSGLNVCLGTDSLASNESLDLRAEMRTLVGLAPREVLAMATVNAARALHRSDQMGKIAPGSMADLAAVPLDGDPYESVVCSEQPVCFVMVGGKVQRQ